jgi:hypothetical protein
VKFVLLRSSAFIRSAKKIVKVMKIKAITYPAEEGGYWAEVPAFPGCIT